MHITTRSRVLISTGGGLWVADHVGSLARSNLSERRDQRTGIDKNALKSS